FGTLPPYPGNWFFVTPGLYLTMFTFTVTFLAISLKVSQVLGKKYHALFALFGMPFAAYNLVHILSNINQPQYLFYVLLSLAAVTLVTAALARLLKLNYLKYELNYVVVLAHLFDASTTFLGVDYAGYAEKHVLPTLFIDLTGTAAVMYPLKLLVLLPALYYVDKEMPAQEDEFERRLLKLIILILGAAPGIRNLVLLVLG
ncbi:MAG: DUF63 family protein, partial [Candidatus Altiarchaeales archaeon]|nr:DUF63 family protein [Candidatus Altiarchaeales archaeon]